MPQYDSWSPISHLSPTGDPRIQALTAPGVRWYGNITYSFPQADALWAAGYPPGNGAPPPSGGFSPFTAANQDQFRTAIAKWAELIPVTFTEVPDGVQVGDIRAAYYASTASTYVGYAHYPAESPWAGDIWFSPTLAGYKPGLVEGWPHPYSLMLHEIGHALGLSHPTDGPVQLPPDELSQLRTVMYTDDMYNMTPTTPMVLDVLAIQSMYGANHATRAGDDTYAYGDARVYDETIWDGGGNDTLAYTGARDAKIDINDGHSSRIGRDLYSVVNGVTTKYDNVWVAYGASIENAHGGSGNDTLIGNPGNNVLDGGDGRDTVSVESAHTASTVTNAGNGTFTISGPGGADTLVNDERIHFNDGYAIALDIGGDAGQAYRLYQAAFDRQPDLPGLGYQMNDLDMGVTLDQVASNFIASPEFQRTYGNVDNTQFITLLYANVLDRTPDAGGLQFHLDEFAHGESRAQMLIHFSESPENQANVIGAIGNGMLYVPIG